MIKLILITIIILGIVFIALGFNIFFRKNGKFPQTSVGKNKKIRELGLNCAKHDEIKCRNEIENKDYCSACEQL